VSVINQNQIQKALELFRDGRITEAQDLLGELKSSGGYDLIEATKYWSAQTHSLFAQNYVDFIRHAEAAKKEHGISSVGFRESPTASAAFDLIKTSLNRFLECEIVLDSDIPRVEFATSDTDYVVRQLMDQEVIANIDDRILRALAMAKVTRIPAKISGVASGALIAMPAGSEVTSSAPKSVKFFQSLNDKVTVFLAQNFSPKAMNGLSLATTIGFGLLGQNQGIADFVKDVNYTDFVREIVERVSDIDQTMKVISNFAPISDGQGGFTIAIDDCNVVGNYLAVGETIKEISVSVVGPNEGSDFRAVAEHLAQGLSKKISILSMDT
jgi:hypothetical protein